jgi:hypothetical protein
MLLSPEDAKRFMATYEQVALAVHAIAALDPPDNPTASLVHARERLQETPELLDEAETFLRRQGTWTDVEVLDALRQMKLEEYVHLKDLKRGAIFLSADGSEAYSAIGLTQPPAAIIGARGHVVHTALCPFAEKIVCDGVFITRAQLGPGLWSEFHKRYLGLKAAGQLHHDPSTVPEWQQPAFDPDPAMASGEVLEILDPWQMVPLEVVDAALAFLDAYLQPHHPLREYRLFPMLKREDAQIWVMTKDDDDGITWLLDLTKKCRFKGRTIYHYRQLADDEELKALIQQDHQTWLDSFPDDDEDDV